MFSQRPASAIDAQRSITASVGRSRAWDGAPRRPLHRQLSAHVVPPRSCLQSELNFTPLLKITRLFPLKKKQSRAGFLSLRLRPSPLPGPPEDSPPEVQAAAPRDPPVHPPRALCPLLTALWWPLPERQAGRFLTSLRAQTHQEDSGVRPALALVLASSCSGPVATPLPECPCPSPPSFPATLSSHRDGIAHSFPAPHRAFLPPAS